MIPTSFNIASFFTWNLFAGVFLLTTAAAIILSIVFTYHWNTYAIPDLTLRRMRFLYFAGLAVFIAFQLIGLFNIP